ncbi:hypothetical protein C8Q79DRAFT_1013332 [Trametes meyenii]|nr:hypothetical protein C8Q79DRAFT_1013332 [Trametes meyenii]
MVAQLTVPEGQSSSGYSHGTLHPYTYGHSNASKSDISIDVRSTTTSGRSRRGARLDVAHRPEASGTSRVAARGISRVASRAPSHAASRATSRSRSRAPSPVPSRTTLRTNPPSPNPFPTHIDLPNGTITVPTTSQNTTLAIPLADAILPSPRSLALPPLLNEAVIWPVLAIPRYDDYPTVSPDRPSWNLPPVTLSFSTEDVPPDWVSCAHPEGRLYFYHPIKRIYTDADVRDHTILAILEAFERRLCSIIQDNELALPNDYELVLYLEERKISGGYNWLYYYVDHATRSLFWLEELNIIEMLGDDSVPGIKTPSCIKYEIESKYWYHWEMYPHRHEVQEEVFTELSAILTFASVDTITSMTSTVTYRADEVHRMLGLVKSAKAASKMDFSTVAVARLMSLLMRQRFLNLYGQTFARLQRDQSVYKAKEHNRTPLIRLLSPLFWNAPQVHLRSLERIWIDGIITIVPWSTFIGKLHNEWQEFVLYATVLLNANVAFLAIPSVDDGTTTLTAAQISSYLSIVTSVGSILLGLLLVRQHRVKSKDTADDAWRYLSSRKHPTLGLETLAIIYSLPYALLMWGMVTFLLAFSFECFTTPDKVGVFTTAAGWIAVAMLVFWSIFTGWESDETSIWERVQSRLKTMVPAKLKASIHDDGASVRPQGMDEKSVQKWLARVLRHNVFPHSSDPPPTEPDARGGSSV